MSVILCDCKSFCFDVLCLREFNDFSDIEYSASEMFKKLSLKKNSTTRLKHEWCWNCHKKNKL